MSAVSADYGQSTSTVYQREQAEKAAANSGMVSSVDFLKLLTTQLTNQDPLSPMEDIDFTAQLAQLQALDSQMEMTKSVNAMRLDTQLQAGTVMIGKYVSGVDEGGAVASGQVDRVVQSDGSVFVELTNKQRIPVTGVNNVWNDAADMAGELGSAGNVVGMWVDAGYDSAQQPVKGIIEKVEVSGGKVQFRLYGGQLVDWDQIKELRVPTQDEQYYTLPDELRAKVERAAAMQDKGVTGKDGSGKTVNGIVGGAVLDQAAGKVYLLLYDGSQVDVDTLIGDPRTPTADDAAASLRGLWVAGLDGEGNQIGGIVDGAEDNDDGMAIILDDGRRVYFDSITEVRDATDEERGRLGDA
jgi:flagellar basal-body rod modification protein FlgD